MTKRSGMLVALALAAAFVVGCGSSSSPSAPVDTVAPAAVLDVGAEYVQGVVEVTWTGGTEADLVGYRVYRSTNGAEPALVGFETTTTYVDVLVAPRSSYRYEVTAVDQAGNESARAMSGQLFIQPPTPGRGQLSSD